MCEFELIIPEDHPIILELFLILFTTDYSKNYSGIMYACLTTNNESSATVHLCNKSPYYLCRVSNVKIRLLQNNLLTAVTCWTNSHLNTATVVINSIAFLR